MRILVTGGAGFIGSHVVDAYIQAGYEVCVLDDLSRGKREQVNPHAHFVRMDLRSPDLRDLLAEGDFGCINHHAAQIDVRVSVADPTRDAMINIVGTLNLLEAARAHGVPRVIFASTGGAIYGEQRHFPATEHHPTSPVSPYGVAKLAVEHYLEYYRQVHGLRYVVLRYANVYGPRQDPEGEAGVVAIFCGKVLRGQRLIIYGDGEQTRDYVYVGDVARANLLALRYLTTSVESVESVASVECGRSFGPRLNNSKTQKLNNSSNVFNIGTGIETSVNALAAMLLEAADADCPIVYHPARPGEQKRSVIDPSLARLVLGWEPLISVAEGLDQTLAWFRSKEAVSTQARNPC
jgi:UDP-glucose 4-epimerase